MRRHPRPFTPPCLPSSISSHVFKCDRSLARAYACRILGDSFLRSFYAAYNVQDNTVGLAKATAQRTGDACEADAAISATATSGGGDAPAATTDPAPVPADTPAPTVAAAEDARSPAPTSDATTQEAATSGSGAVAADTPAPEQLDSSSPAPSVAGTDGNEIGSNEDGAAADLGDSEAGGGQEEERGPSMAMVAMAASMGTLFAVAICGGIGVLVVRRIRRGEYRHTKLGAGGTLELGSNGGGRGGGSTVVGDEDDFLQAEPGRYRGNSGSHRYRVAAETGVANGGGGGGGIGRLTVMGTDREDDGDDGDSEHDEEVEVDFGGARATGAATPSVGALGGGFDRGEQGETFATFGDDQRGLV